MQIKADEIQGKGLNSGKAEGYAKVFKSPKEINNFRRGNILVIKRSTIDYSPIVEQASAVVMDHGLDTSHGTIAIGGYGIPCVGGTQMATKIFKDNDFLEVDADQGIVRKLF